MPREAEATPVVQGGAQRRGRAIPKELPGRSAAYLEFVRSHECMACGRPPPSVAHHQGQHGMGTKTSDYRTVPLCGEHHDHWHRCGYIPALGHSRGRTLAAFEQKQVDLLVEWCERGAS